MKIQGILDLSGFELQNFCIQNYTDKDNVANLGVGRKFFFTGNSTDQDYNREVIWDGDRWRAAAYLDDIDKITNGEGSLGTRVKALEDMLGLKDVTDVIDTWNDVKEFFKDVDEGLNLMTMLDGKLDKTGGTISGTLDINSILTAWGRVKAYGLMEFNYNDDGQVIVANDKHAGLGEGNQLALYSNKRWYTILHSGNVGDYALKTDGSNAMTDGLQLLTMGSGSVNVAVTEGLFIYRGPSSGGTDVGLPGNYINVFNVGGANAYSNLQLAWRRDYPNPALYARIGESTNYSDWKTIAFTDSDITGNAATATKLKDKVSLWGNDFDGTQSLNGNIHMPNGSALYFITTNQEYIAAVNIASDNVLTFGNGTNFSTRTLNTRVDGYNIYFRTGAKQTAMTITDGGNVLVSCSGYSHTLEDGLHQGITVGSATGAQGQMWINGNADFSIQSANVSKKAAYTLNLNPLGGAVNVGGNLAPNANNSLSLGTSSYRWSDVYSVLGDFSGRVLIGGAADDGSTALQVKGGVLVSSTASWQNETTKITQAGLSLIGRDIGGYNQGTFFYNQNDVLIAFAGIYATGGTDAITSYNIGPNTVPANAWFSINSTESFFNVATTFNGGALIPTGQKLTIGDANGDHATIEYDSIAKAIKVDGNLFTTGTNASGGKADAQQGGTGGNAEVYKYDLEEGEQSYDVQNVKGDVNVNVQVYEWNGNSSSWDMILTDVSVTNDTITVTFGRPTTVPHMVTVV